MRRTSISMTWTPGVQDDEAQVFVRTLEDIYRLLRRHFGKPGQFDLLPMVRVFGAWTIQAAPRGAVYGGVQWYVDRSLDAEHGRLLASHYIRAVSLEPWQTHDPHFDLALTDLALVGDHITGSPPREVLGIARPGMVTLISSNQLRSIDNPDLRMLALRDLVAHYFGRLLIVPFPDRAADTAQQEGECYCANECAMRFTDTPALALHFGQQLVASGKLYCDACQQDMVKQLAGYHFGLN